MAQNVVINGVTYQNCPEVDIPKSGGGTAKFFGLRCERLRFWEHG